MINSSNMTGLEIAAAGATIVQLIGQFKQGRKDAEAEDYDAFVRWLQTQRHDEVVNLLAGNNALQIEATNLLRQDNQVMIGKMDEMSSMILQVSASFAEFRGVFESMGARPQADPEAIKLLKELVEKDWRKFAVGGQLGSRDPLLINIEGECRDLTCDEQFFLQDLDQLARMDFLDADYMTSGEKTYALTRKGYNYVKNLPK